MGVVKICAECEHWQMGDTWSCGNRKTTIECKGWCTGKPNKRKRWNYHPATKCKLFSRRKMKGFLYEGGNLSLEEDLNNISELMKTLAEDNRL